MHKFVRKLLTEWRKLELPFEGETFVVAVSGGADSVALALALEDLRQRKKLNNRYVLAHFNHDLRGAESEKDAEFVTDLARKFDFELVYQKGKLSKKGNLEQNARLARYEFLLETVEDLKAYGILTAHSLNDQAETFLLNLIRGSGVAGLSAMKPITLNYELRITNYENQDRIEKRSSQFRLIRPLLNWAMREETEHFCAFRQIEYRDDSMNEDLNFKRVRIRKVLLPLLRDFNPRIIETLANTAKLLQIETAETKTEDHTLSAADGFLILKDLTSLSKPALYRTLRAWLKRNRANLRQLDSKHFESIERLIGSRKSGRTVELPGGEIVVKENGRLYWKKKTL